MFEGEYLLNKGTSYRGFFICPVRHHKGYTYRCFRPEAADEMQLGHGLFSSLLEAIEAGKAYLDREWQYHKEIGYYKQLLQNQAITEEEYCSHVAVLEQTIWGLT